MDYASFKSKTFKIIIITIVLTGSMGKLTVNIITVHKKRTKNSGGRAYIFLNF